MKLAKTSLNTKIFIVGIIAAVVVAGFSGCGKSEAQRQRDAARQEFKEAVAAIKVRTEDSTYSEFRQAELDLKTSYEANKTYLNDLSNQFASLDTLMNATDYFWAKNIEREDGPIYIGSKTDLDAIEIISPEVHIKEKLNLPVAQMENDPDFHTKIYLQKGLAEISNQADGLLNLLTK